MWIRLVLVPLASALMLMTAAAQQQEDPVFGFIPPGGRTLLSGLLDAGAADSDIAGLLASDRDAAAWESWLAANSGTVPGLALLDEWGVRTLAAYLANAGPSPAEGLAGDALRRAMPRDGRDLIMRYCQSCHIITVTVTQERTRDAWLGTLNNPSHVEIAIDSAGRSELADYLVINAGIPIDQIPVELRAGGASY
jgi:mono/diheme cytochrome c family protein